MLIQVLLQLKQSLDWIKPSCTTARLATYREYRRRRPHSSRQRAASPDLTIVVVPASAGTAVESTVAFEDRQSTEVLLTIPIAASLEPSQLNVTWTAHRRTSGLRSHRDYQRLRIVSWTFITSNDNHFQFPLADNLRDQPSCCELGQLSSRQQYVLRLN